MFRSEKPLTAITVLIERLTKEEYDVDDLGDLPTLIEAIRLQRSTGPTEAARAIRKKLKYGNPHRQLRALTILDALIQNAGTGFQKSFADEPLLERLRYIVTDPATDDEVKAKCHELYRGWAHAYKDTPGMNNVANLYRQLPQRKRVPNKETSKVLRETERDIDEDEPTSPRKASVAEGERRRSSVQEYHAAASSLTFAPANYYRSGLPTGPPVKTVTKKDKKHKHSKSSGNAQQAFNFEKEKSQINNVIGQASIEATGLMNSLKHVNRETQRVSDNSDCKRRFEACKALRRQTFRFCSLVMDEGYLGTLLNANDQLSDALILYEQLDKSFDYDSDSEDYDDPDAPSVPVPGRGSAITSPTSTEAAMGRMSLGGSSPPPQPPRPQFTTPSFTVAEPTASGKGKERDLDPTEEDDEDDEDDPFADRNAVSTPHLEKEGMTWR